MNVFYLSRDAVECAQWHNDKHVVKMMIEYAQLLSTAHRVLDGTEYTDLSANGRKIKRYRLAENDDIIYKASHINHPSAVWARQSDSNYNWLYFMWASLSAEYTYRYGKIHACWEKLGALLATVPTNIQTADFTPPPPAMKQYPQCIVENDSIQSYRNYYREAKAHFCKWTSRPTPHWFAIA